MADGLVARLRAAGCVFAEEEAALLRTEAASPDLLEGLVARRVAGEPLEHVLGWVRFCGLRIALDPGVFVPRRRTELLARAALEVLPAGGTAVDLCCGAGAVAAVLSTRGGPVHASDIDPAEVRCARRNLPADRVHEGDLFAALPVDLRGVVDVITANTPYVPTGAIATMPPEAREHEPRLALDGGADGLDVARRVVTGADAWLRLDGGWLLIECGERQAPALAAAFARAGFTADVHVDPDLDATVVRGRIGAASMST